MGNNFFYYIHIQTFIFVKRRSAKNRIFKMLMKGVENGLLEMKGNLTPLKIIRIRKEGNILFNDAFNTFYLRLLWHQTRGKGPLR